MTNLTQSAKVLMDDKGYMCVYVREKRKNIDFLFAHTPVIRKGPNRFKISFCLGPQD